MDILAKSKKNGKCQLDKHSIAVINLGIAICKHMLHKDYFHYDEVLKQVVIACLFHDIGKCYTEYQDLFKKGDSLNYSDDTNYAMTTDYISHNIFSWGYMTLSTNIKRSTANAILYHHPLPIENKVMNNHEVYYKIVSNQSLNVFDEYLNFGLAYLKNNFNIDLKIIGDNKNDNLEQLPSFYIQNTNKDCNIYELDSTLTIIRTCLIVSDRYCSSIEDDELELVYTNDQNTITQIIHNWVMMSENDLSPDLKKYMDNPCRIEKQLALVNEINNHHTMILDAAAGFGKTLVGLLWALKNKKKILWVCPRNEIAFNTYHSITNELADMGLSNIKVNLLLSGRYVEGTKETDDDITITNIDNFLGFNIKNNFSHKLFNFCGSNVIFDEFHEFISSAPLFAAFINTMFLRHNMTNGNTLLLSATPGCNINAMWDGFNIMCKTHIEHTKSPFGESKFNVHKLYATQNIDIEMSKYKDTALFLNSVDGVQTSVYYNDMEQCYHAIFTEADRKNMMAKLFEQHGKHNANREIERDSVIGNSLLTTGLDTSYSNGIENVCSPEKTLQCITGRINRWGELGDDTSDYYYAVLDDTLRETKAVMSIYDIKLRDLWVAMLDNYNGQTITRDMFYDIYREFNIIYSKEIKDYYNKCHTKSMQALIELKPKRSSKLLDYRKCASGMTFRGITNSMFISCQIDETNIFSDPILYTKEKYLDKIEGTLTDNIRKKHIKKLINDSRFKFTKNHGEKNGAKRGCNKSYQEFKTMAKSEMTPLICENLLYNKKYGVYDKEMFDLYKLE